jgi:hypothetical protein
LLGTTMDHKANVVELSLYGLDAKWVTYFRRVRDCLPVVDVAKARRIVAKLRTIGEMADRYASQFEELASELADLDVGGIPFNLEWAFHSTDPDTDWWKRAPEPVKYRPSQEECSTRPTSAQGLEAWNRFVISLEQEPVRMYRTGPKRENEWAAQFTRKDGTAMYAELSVLVGRRRSASLCFSGGWFPAGSLAEVADQIAAWLDDRDSEA